MMPRIAGALLGFIGLLCIASAQSHAGTQSAVLKSVSLDLVLNYPAMTMQGTVMNTVRMSRPDSHTIALSAGQNLTVMSCEPRSRRFIKAHSVFLQGVDHHPDHVPHCKTVRGRTEDPAPAVTKAPRRL